MEMYQVRKGEYQQECYRCFSKSSDQYVSRPSAPLEMWGLRERTG